MLDLTALRQEIDLLQSELYAFKLSLSDVEYHQDITQGVIDFYTSEIAYARQRLKQATERKGQ